MALDIGVVKVEYLSMPKEDKELYTWLRDELVMHLLQSFPASNEGNIYGSFEQEDWQVFARENLFPNPDLLKRVLTWIDSLPWESGMLDLNFNW